MLLFFERVLFFSQNNLQSLMAWSINCLGLPDFEGIDKFGLQALTPKEFLEKIGEI